MRTVYESNSAEETRALGKRMGEEAQAGDVIALTGDLGVGKTVFTKGIAEGLGVKEPVSSPTFTILQEYRSGRVPLYHFDVYRIGDPEEMDEVGFDDYIYGDGLCLIEWAELISDLMPDHYRQITIEKDLTKGFDYRRIIVEDK
jgi:tRNA threonylcarbamoyladenosine biosynthesis protein TsaE